MAARIAAAAWRNASRFITRFRAPLPPMTLFSKSLSPASALMDTMSGFVAHGRRTSEKGRHAWRRALNRGVDDDHTITPPPRSTAAAAA